MKFMNLVWTVNLAIAHMPKSSGNQIEITRHGEHTKILNCNVSNNLRMTNSYKKVSYKTIYVFFLFRIYLKNIQFKSSKYHFRKCSQKINWVGKIFCEI